jgi:hypothetical protein
MKKLIQVMREEEVLSLVVIVFLFVALITTGASLLGPLQLTKEQAMQYYAHFNPVHEWLFIAIPPVAIALLVGISATLWKAQWPSHD